MNIFKNYTFTWWQMGIFKLALLSIGIVIGANWSLTFVAYTPILILIGAIVAIYLAVISFRK